MKILLKFIAEMLMAIKITGMFLTNQINPHLLHATHRKNLFTVGGVMWFFWVGLVGGAAISLPHGLLDATKVGLEQWIGAVTIGLVCGGVAFIFDWLNRLREFSRNYFLLFSNNRRVAGYSIEALKDLIKALQKNSAEWHVKSLAASLEANDGAFVLFAEALSHFERGIQITEAAKFFLFAQQIEPFSAFRREEVLKTFTINQPPQDAVPAVA